MTLPVPVRILITALALAAALIGLVVREDRARASGQEVLLAMEAVDPRNLLTGHYVAIRLAERLAPGQACPPGLSDLGSEGWLALRPGAGRHSLAGAGRTRADALRHGPIVVRGTADCDATTPRIDAEPAPPRIVALHLGVDRFHADQARAEGVEEALRDQRPGDPARAFAVVSAGRDGRARLKGIILDGRRIDLDWF
jgi:hypothetical protein